MNIHTKVMGKVQWDNNLDPFYVFIQGATVSDGSVRRYIERIKGILCKRTAGATYEE